MRVHGVDGETGRRIDREASRKGGRALAQGWDIKTLHLKRASCKLPRTNGSRRAYWSRELPARVTGVVWPNPVVEPFSRIGDRVSRAEDAFAFRTKNLAQKRIVEIRLPSHSEAGRESLVPAVVPGLAVVQYVDRRCAALGPGLEKIVHTRYAEQARESSLQVEVLV